MYNILSRALSRTTQLETVRGRAAAPTRRHREAESRTLRAGILAERGSRLVPSCGGHIRVCPMRSRPVSSSMITFRRSASSSASSQLRPSSCDSRRRSARWRARAPTDQWFPHPPSPDGNRRGPPCSHRLGLGCTWQCLLALSLYDYFASKLPYRSTPVRWATSYRSSFYEPLCGQHERSHFSIARLRERHLRLQLGIWSTGGGGGGGGAGGVDLCGSWGRVATCM
jgi:hypothetical protein